MASKKPKGGSEEHPEGPKMDVSTVERHHLRDLRKKRGWTQHQLALRIGLTNGTISNFESGTSKQVFRSVYAKIVRALTPKQAALSAAEAKSQAEAFGAFVSNVADLTPEQLASLVPVIETLKKSRQSGSH